MSVGVLIRNLTAFADFYQAATGSIERAEPLSRRYEFANRDVNADYFQRVFLAAVGIDRVRAYVLARYGDDLTLGTARRLLGDLIRELRVTVEEAEALTLTAAMDRIDAATRPMAAKPTEGTEPKVTDGPVQPSLLDQAKQFLAEKDQEQEIRDVAMRLLPYILFPPNGPFGSPAGSTGTNSADTDASPPVAQQGEGVQSPADASNEPPACSNRKPPIRRPEAERLVEAAIASTPPDQRDKLSTRALSRATGVSLGMIPGLDSWRKLQDEKAGSVRAVPLTDAIHAVLNDPSADAADPAEVAADAEVLCELLTRAATDAERMRYEAMTPGERWLMLEALKEQTADAQRDQRRPRRERPDRS
jgi:hypothetical protein